MQTITTIGLDIAKSVFQVLKSSTFGTTRSFGCRTLSLEKGERAAFSAGLMAGPIAESLPPWRAMWKLTEVKEGAVIMSCLGAGDDVAPGDPAKVTCATV
jgi:hypothetical protein